MEEDEIHILHMLQDGFINAEEAETLLDAIGTENPIIDKSEHGSAITNPVAANNIPPVMPYRDKLGRFTTVIHLLVIGSLLISAIGLALMYQSVEQVALIGFLCTWSIFIVSLLMNLLLVLARSSPWLHLGIQRIEGRSISLSFPLPVALVGWGIRIARPLITKKNEGKLDLASAYIKAMASNPNPQPMVLNLNDVDGTRVEVILG